MSDSVGLRGEGAEQTSVTRNLLARLDLGIIELEAQQRRALEIKRLTQDHATACGVLKAALMGVRDELRPLLDSSAPRGYPYDKR